MSKEIKIAITACVALVLLFIGLNFLKGINVFTSTNTYYVHFQNANGLAVSTPVYANGYAVGIVRDIDYDYTDATGAVVTVELDDEMRVPVGTHAELESELMGGVKMTLVLGPNPASHIAVKDTIPGKLHYGMAEQLGEMLPAVQNLMPKLDSILTNLQQITSDPALLATLRNAEAMTADLQKASAGLSALMSQEVPAIAQNLKTTTEKTAALADNLAAIDVQATMQSVNKTLDGAQQLTESLSTTVSTLNNSLTSTKSSLGLLLNDRQVYDNLNSTLANADSLMIDLKAHPKRYVHFSVFGKKEK